MRGMMPLHPSAVRAACADATNGCVFGDRANTAADSQHMQKLRAHLELEAHREHNAYSDDVQLLSVDRTL